LPITAYRTAGYYQSDEHNCYHKTNDKCQVSNRRRAFFSLFLWMLCCQSLIVISCCLSVLLLMLIFCFMLCLLF